MTEHHSAVYCIESQRQIKCTVELNKKLQNISPFFTVIAHDHEPINVWASAYTVQRNIIWHIPIHLKDGSIPHQLQKVYCQGCTLDIFLASENTAKNKLRDLRISCNSPIARMQRMTCFVDMLDVEGRKFKKELISLAVIALMRLQR